MIILYPLKPQPDYTEFKFSLRSIEKYIIGPFWVCVAGMHVPEWIDRGKIVQIFQSDRPGRKQLSIRSKVLAALRVAESIYFLSDDVYLTQPMDPRKSPYFTSGTLKTVGEAGAKRLMDQLTEIGKPIKQYDCHCPIRYDQRFQRAVSSFHEDCIIKSAFGNYYELDSVEMPDFKVNRELSPEAIRKTISKRPYWSTGPQGIKSALPVLEELYPEKSRFEL